MNKTLKNLLDTKEININVADMLLYVYQNDIHPSKQELVSILKLNNCDEKEGIYLWVMNELEMNLNDSSNKYLCNKYFFNNIEKQNIGKYAGNPYVKAIKDIRITNSKYAIKKLSYEPYQIFPLDDIKINEKDYYSEATPLGFFDDKYSYLALLENNKIWMSLNPNEINTMQPHINKAKGNILVLGLGLGYFPFMCSLKKEVSSITIVERDSNIIKLFNTYLLDKFPNRSKIQVIQSDAIEYLSKNACFDYIFADLWHDPTDGVDLYVKLKKIEHKAKIDISYWIENSLIAMLRRIMLSVYEDIPKGNKISKKELEEDKLISLIFETLKNIEIKNENELIETFSDSNILKLLNLD